jgi:hypothetical protein
VKLYHLEIQHGDYSDARQYYVGSFSTLENREKAKVDILNANDDNVKYFGNIVRDYDNGGWVEWESDIDENIILRERGYAI